MSSSHTFSRITCRKSCTKKTKLIEDNYKISVLEVDFLVRYPHFLQRHVQKVLCKENKTHRRRLQNLCPWSGSPCPASRLSTASRAESPVKENKTHRRQLQHLYPWSGSPCPAPKSSLTSLAEILLKENKTHRRQLQNISVHELVI